MLLVDSTVGNAMIKIPFPLRGVLSMSNLWSEKPLLRSGKEKGYVMGTANTQPVNSHRCAQMRHCWWQEMCQQPSQMQLYRALELLCWI